MHVLHPYVESMVSPPKCSESVLVCGVLQERLARIEQEVADEEQQQRQEAMYKKKQIADAEKRRREGPVDDSEMVDEMFGFIDAQTDSEGAAPAAFKVRSEVTHASWDGLLATWWS